MYRPLSSNEANTSELCKLLKLSSKNSLFLGDFNFPSIDWNLKTCDRKSENFLQAVEENEYDQLVDFKTHICGNILDLALSNRPENIINVEPLGNLANSDHTIILTEILFKSRFCAKDEKICDWKNGNVSGLADYLYWINWENELEQRNTEDSWNFLKDTIHAGIDLFIPKIPRRQRNKPRWMTRKVIKLIRTKQRRYNLYMQTRSPEHEQNFKDIQKQCKKAVRQAKRKFERSIADNGNKRPFNSYIKSRTKTKVGVGPLKVNNVTISDNKGMAAELNTAFCKVFTMENENNIPVCEPLPVNSKISSVSFSRGQVRDKIMKLKPGTAQGPDGIPARLLKDNCDSLCVPLSNIFNKSMRPP